VPAACHPQRGHTGATSGPRTTGLQRTTPVTGLLSAHLTTQVGPCTAGHPDRPGVPDTEEHNTSGSQGLPSALADTPTFFERSTCGEGPIDRRPGAVLAGRHQVGVGPEGETRIGVPEIFGKGFDRHAVL